MRDDDRDAGRGTEISCSIYSDSAASLRSAGTRSPCCPLLVDDTTFSIISDDDKSSRSRTRKFSLPFDRSLRRADSEPDAASPLAAAVFAALPAAVYEGIVRQLEAVHASPRSDTCDTCFLRDLTSLARTSRAWDRASIKTLCVALPPTPRARVQAARH